MIEISNLRIEQKEQWARLIVDIKSDFERNDKENTIWIGVEKEHANMLNNQTYNAFLFLPLYMAMYYKTDLRIRGKVSKKLYRSITKYIESMLVYFKDGLKTINVLVDGFAEIDDFEKTETLVGTGISCGVDCLQTIYDNYCEESDPEYRINSLFMFNCGWHGSYYDKKSFELFIERSKQSRKAADEMGLSMYLVDSNLHAFLPELDDQASYFCLYSCAFALEKALSKYYISSSYSYYDVSKIGFKSRNRDFSEFGDPMAIPLMRSDTLELISDGCQYMRTEKTERIADWSITKKYLNVCCANTSEGNCSVCHKCVRTLLALDAMGKLEDYSSVFDIKKYNEISYAKKCNLVLIGADSTDGFSSDLYRYYKTKGVKLPSKLKARVYTLPSALLRRIKKTT